VCVRVCLCVSGFRRVKECGIGFTSVCRCVRACGCVSACVYVCKRGCLRVLER